ncbi:MAG TPA: ABC-type transport auxiliary lipoprotein family protein [Steroidobacteraceae bacterium]|nr:ABC-type transport auxiliary lipoprotein family protein [Steroidobacteraceae bacterium]
MRQPFGPAVVLGIAIAIAAAGCASGAFNSERPASQLYTLSAAPPETSAATALPIDLAVARPLPRPGLDTERIAVRYADRRFDYYATARWGAEAADVVQDLLIDSLRASGGLRTVHGHLSAFASQYVLESELRDFQAEYAEEGASPTVRVTLVCTVGRVRDRTPLATFTSSATVRADDNSQRAVVAAFENAYRDVGARIVSDTLATLAAVPPAAPAAGPAH